MSNTQLVDILADLDWFAERLRQASQQIADDAWDARNVDEPQRLSGKGGALLSPPEGTVSSSGERCLLFRDESCP